MRRAARLPLLLLGFLATFAFLACAERDRGPTVTAREDGEYLHLMLEDDAQAQAWLYRTPEDEDGDDLHAPVDLIVVLHGAGSTPKDYVMPALMQARRAWCLAVAGRQAVQTGRGQGFMWSADDVKTIVALVRHVIATYPIRMDRVIVWGHSAGGTMALATLGEAPELFAGGLTTASPVPPDGRHAEQRVCVFLGTEDPNWTVAASVRAHMESLAEDPSRGACALLAIEGLGHAVPSIGHLGLGCDWILQGKARGGEARVPRPPRGAKGAYRHILVRYEGARGAEDVQRPMNEAMELLTNVATELGQGRAFFPFEAARHSEDPETAGCGGGIDSDDLEERFGLGGLGLEPGALSEILESPHGLHLVRRSPPERE